MGSPRAPEPEAAAELHEKQHQAGSTEREPGQGVAAAATPLSTLTTPDKLQSYASPEAQPDAVQQPRQQQTVINTVWSPLQDVQRQEQIAQQEPASLAPLSLAFDNMQVDSIAAAAGSPEVQQPAAAPGAPSTQSPTEHALSEAQYPTAKRQQALDRLKWRVLQRKPPGRPAVAAPLASGPTGTPDQLSDAAVEDTKAAAKAGSSSSSSDVAAVSQPGTARPKSRTLHRTDTALLPRPPSEQHQASDTCKREPQQQRQGDVSSAPRATSKPFLRRRSQAVPMQQLPDWSKVTARTSSTWQGTPRSRAGTPGGSSASTPASSRPSTPKCASFWQHQQQQPFATSRFSVPALGAERQERQEPGSAGRAIASVRPDTSGRAEGDARGGGRTRRLERRPATGATPGSAPPIKLDARTTPFVPRSAAPAPKSGPPAAQQPEGWQLAAVRQQLQAAMPLLQAAHCPPGSIEVLLAAPPGPIELPLGLASGRLHNAKGTRARGNGSTRSVGTRSAAVVRPFGSSRLNGSTRRGRAAVVAPSLHVELGGELAAIGGGEGPLDSLLSQVDSLIEAVESAIH